MNIKPGEFEDGQLAVRIDYSQRHRHPGSEVDCACASPVVAYTMRVFDGVRGDQISNITRLQIDCTPEGALSGVATFVVLPMRPHESLEHFDLRVEIWGFGPRD